MAEIRRDDEELLVLELLKEANGSHIILKNFQEDIDIQRKDEDSKWQTEVFTVVSRKPSIATSHLLVKHLRNSELAGLSTEYKGGVFIESTCSGHTDIPIYVNTASLILECQTGYSVLWEEIAASRVDKVAIQQLALVLGRLHHASIKDDVADIPTENNEFTEHLKNSLFHQPYVADKAQSNVVPELKCITTQLQNNPEIKLAVDRLSALLSEKKESFLHGNLSLQNVTVKQGHPKLVNLSFCMVGPRGLDLGLLLASYMMQYHLHMLTPEDNDAHRQISYKMMDACTTTVNTYLEEMQPVLSDADTSLLISETAGFAACELIRKSLSSDPCLGLDRNPSVAAEVFQSGLRLLKKYDSITDIGRLMMIGLQLC